MQTELYLDTARFGRMMPRARTALDDFARLCAAEGGSLRLLDILRGEAEECAVSDWSGIGGLEDSVRSLMNATEHARVLLAERSAPLARVLARALFRRCERVFCTDLDWPRYRALLGVEGRRLGRELFCLPVRDAVVRDGVSREELVRILAERYRSHECDGLFLSDVTFEGIRIPVAELVRELRQTRSPRFVAVDGAQAAGHVPGDLESLPCDAYLAGCHKWLSAGQTLGFVVCPRPRSRGPIDAVLREMIDSGEIDDPLLLLLMELDGKLSWHAGDTADLACLFSGSAALTGASSPETSPDERLASCQANTGIVREVVRSTGWRAFPVHPQLETGIILLEPAGDSIRRASPEDVRRRFQERGVALTVFPGGILRASLPGTTLTPAQLGPLRETLRVLA